MEAREYHDAYSESLEADFRELESALLSDTVKILAPNEPIKCSPETTVHAAILKMMEKRRASWTGKASCAGSSPSAICCAGWRCRAGIRKRPRSAT